MSSDRVEPPFDSRRYLLARTNDRRTADTIARLAQTDFADVRLTVSGECFDITVPLDAYNRWATANA